MTLIIKPDGTVESIGRMNPYDETDATRVSIPNGGDGRVFAWISGTHWGKFAVSGQGGVLLQKVDAQSPAFRCEASGSIQSFSVIVQGTRTFVLGAVRQATAEDETLGYQVYAGLASFPQ